MAVTWKHPRASSPKAASRSEPAPRQPKAAQTPRTAPRQPKENETCIIFGRLGGARNRDIPHFPKTGGARNRDIPHFPRSGAPKRAAPKQPRTAPKQPQSRPTAPNVLAGLRRGRIRRKESFNPKSCLNHLWMCWGVRRRTSRTCI